MPPTPDEAQELRDLLAAIEPLTDALEGIQRTAAESLGIVAQWRELMASAWDVPTPGSEWHQRGKALSDALRERLGVLAVLFETLRDKNTE
ncbi:hypothetical protein [Candidatus Poriferisodalis sp.]|uniref:hypothetical protein n=1 Tax=Candidatus Poriferisodalis sp. TaxID=3101277 RepID=UPI003B51AB50